jgi:uncharacterized protein
MSRREVLSNAAIFVRNHSSGDSSGHDWWHIERVRKTALAIARDEGADLFVVELAALLHDVDDWKLAGGKQDAGPVAAREWMESQQLEADTIDHVCRIIDELSFKGARVATPMSSLEGACVQDADRLDALGAVGIGRTFAYGGHKGQAMHDPDRAPIAHDSFEAYQKNVGTTVNHFYEKLLLLKDRMNTAAAKRLAAGRHAYMEQFLSQFLAEWEGER